MKNKKDDEKKAKPTDVMTAKQVKGAKASYKATTGMEYKPKTALPGKAAPKMFKSKAEKDAYFKNKK